MAGVQSEALDGFSQFIGWLYFIAWSVSFWPQTILNYRRKSVTGLSLDFLLYNVTGFFFYTVYAITKYVSDKQAKVTQSVEPNDIAFGIHAVLLTLVCLYQFHAYKASGRAPLTPAHGYIVSVLWVVAMYNLLLVAAGVLSFYNPYDQSVAAFSFIDYLGYSKAVISGIKYVPQAYMNWRRQSTVGWSIINILLDFTGGSLSFTQQFIDAYNRQDGNVIWGNIPKLLLALESVVFDILFMVQHYVLYTNRADPVAKLNDEEGGSVAATGGDGTQGSQYEQLHSPINVGNKASEDDEKGSNGHGDGHSSHR